MARFAERHGLTGQQSELAESPVVRAAIDECVQNANRSLSRVEQIKTFTVLPDVWEPGSEYLTPTTKLRRKPIEEHYCEVIDAMY